MDRRDPYIAALDLAIPASPADARLLQALREALKAGHSILLDRAGFPAYSEEVGREHIAIDLPDVAGSQSDREEG